MKLRLEKNQLEKIADTPILINLRNGGYYSLNEPALFILKCLRRGYSTKKIAKKVAKNYKISLSNALYGVNYFTKKMSHAGFFKRNNH